jgi:hypothetical protein
MKTSLMKKPLATILPLILMTLGASTAATATNITEQLLQEYRASGAQTFSASTGRAAWDNTSIDPKSGKARSCSSCHTSNLRQVSKHVRTGKAIKPLAPSVNPKRLTDRKHIEKWFKRNCKWVLGRECTPQEKGDYLTYIRSL